MPRPGTTCWASIRLPTPSWPAARALSAASRVVSPAGSCLPMIPAKIRSVAWPRIFGPTTFSATLTTPSAIVTATPARSGRSRAASRLADGPKFDAFSVGWPTPAHGGPPLPPRATRILRATSLLVAPGSDPSCAGAAAPVPVLVPVLVSVLMLSLLGALGAAPAGNTPCSCCSVLGALGAAPAGNTPCSCCGLHAELRLDDLDVGRGALQELLVGADADDGAVLQDHDLVGLEDRRHPLRDDQHGGLGGHRAQRGPQPGVGGQV